MERTPVTSSSIASIGYDPTEKVLEVEFHHGGVFQYFDVPGEEYEAFRAADSIGRYFTQHLGKYAFQRM